MSKAPITLFIKENEKDLLKRYRQESDKSVKERLHFLYLLKSGQVTTQTKASQLLGRHRHTIRRWLEAYESGGLEKYLTVGHGGGKVPQVSPELLEALKSRLSESEGFNSYFEIQLWLEERGCSLNYEAVFWYVNRKLGARPKVARPKNPKQDPQRVESFKKTLPRQSSI